MFSLEEVIKFHDQAIDLFGGAKGVRDYGSLDSALHRPWQTFGGEDLYTNCFEKAAAIVESIILNHPFIDGNKRTGFLLCEAILEDEGYTIVAQTSFTYNFLIDISTGSLSFEKIVTWLIANTAKNNTQ